MNPGKPTCPPPSAAAPGSAYRFTHWQATTFARSRGRCRPEGRWRRCRGRGFPSAEWRSRRQPSPPRRRPLRCHSPASTAAPPAAQFRARVPEPPRARLPEMRPSVRCRARRPAHRTAPHSLRRMRRTPHRPPWSRFRGSGFAWQFDLQLSSTPSAAERLGLQRWQVSSSHHQSVETIRCKPLLGISSVI